VELITIACWRWGQKYGPQYVSNLKAAVARNLSMPHRFVCITDQKDTPGETLPIENPELLSVRDGCYARLRMFDPVWQLKHGIERIVCFDLDLVVTGQLDPLFNRPEPFMILHGNHFNPCPFNGSVMMISRCARPDIWTRFNLAEAERVSFIRGKWRGTDQTWIAHVAPDAPGWTYKDGIYGYEKRGWPVPGGAGWLPADARIVTFNGKRDPARQPEEWVARHWSAQHGSVSGPECGAEQAVSA
jgi:hypothetical protein